MPKIRPASDEERRTFRKTLTPRRRPQFDELAELIGRPRQDLDWYHRVGCLTIGLQPLPGEADYHGRAWFGGLSRALGPGRWLFYKAVRFAQLYPAAKALRELNALGVDWSRLTLSFAIKDPKERLDLLTEALEDGWTISRFHFEAKRRHPTGRRGVGGQPRRRLTDVGPEAALEELLTASRAWLHVYREVWGRPGGAVRKKIKQLVRQRGDAQGVLGELKEACGEIGW